MQRQCQSCGNYPHWRSKYQELALFECAICNSLSYLTDSPVATSHLYGPEYFAGLEYIDYQGEKKIHRKNFSKKWHIIKNLINGSPKVLEIGCAYGYFIDYVLKNGATEAFGIDLSPDVLKVAQENFGSHFGTPDDQPPFEYNCLVAWDVWEHLPLPLQTFQEHVKRLRPGGIFAMTTVDVSSRLARIRGRKWRQIHPPTHLHYPSRQGLQMAIEIMGLKILVHESFGMERSWRTYMSAIGVRAGSLEKGFSLDLGDIQILIAQKEIL